jgi:hypothetical protein
MEFGETLVALAAVLIGGAVLLVPIAAFATRFALKPLIETWALARNPQMTDKNALAMERRISLLEDQVSTLERQNARLVEDADFRMRLESSH